MNESLRAVITGDLVRSGSLKGDDYQRVIETLGGALNDLSSGNAFHFSIFRGDSFQLVTPEIWRALHIATCVRLYLKSAEVPSDARQSIAIAAVMETSVDVSTATGEAYIRSGRNLDKLKKEHLVFDSINQTWNTNLGLLLKWLDIHLSSLTQTQAQVLLAYLQSPDLKHQQLADKIAKSRVNTTQILNAAKHKLVKETLDYFEGVVGRA
ncbi:hypothetical protein [Aliidiomarina sanyensis]|uniref:Uncharacterized protein n=1 Tax=Aliidiomarina sanyensis TaxID=1249555 RepID=A0A432WNY1_9GAMM|nr:hypothetical protein [Aliidiomarina sanyensis]RUO35419.1 hypothetical protein CWE11_05255 [Aliidiomarina sanyensis]